MKSKEGQVPALVVPEVKLHGVEGVITSVKRSQRRQAGGSGT